MTQNGLMHHSISGVGGGGSSSSSTRRRKRRNQIIIRTFLSVFISVINHIDAPQPVHETVTYRCDDTRGCVMQF